MNSLFVEEKSESFVSKYSFGLIDSNNLFWRHFLNPKTSRTTFYKNNIVFVDLIKAFLENVKSLKDEFFYKDSKLYFLFDNPISKVQSRKQIDSEYKHTRGEVPEGFYNTLDVIKQILLCDSNFNTVCFAKGYEADDLTFPILKSLKVNNEYRVLMFSNDLDWARNLTEFVHWNNWKTIYKMENFYDKFKFKPTSESVKLYKCLRGDASDNIAVGCPNLSEELLHLILIECDSLHSLLSNLENVPISQEWKFKITKNKDRLLLNYKLVDFLNKDLKLAEFTQEGFQNKEALNSIFKAINFEEPSLF